MNRINIKSIEIFLSLNRHFDFVGQIFFSLLYFSRIQYPQIDQIDNVFSTLLHRISILFVKHTLFSYAQEFLADCDFFALGKTQLRHWISQLSNNTAIDTHHTFSQTYTKYFINKWVNRRTRKTFLQKRSGCASMGRYTLVVLVALIFISLCFRIERSKKMCWKWERGKQRILNATSQYEHILTWNLNCEMCWVNGLH